MVYSQTKNTCVASSAREEKKHHKDNHGCYSPSAFKDLQRPVVIIRSEVCFFFLSSFVILALGSFGFSIEKGG